MVRNLSAIKKPYVYSTSVPISLPTGSKTSHSWEDDDNDNNVSVLKNYFMIREWDF